MQIMEVTGTTEDNARTALFDTDNNTNLAIELILEQGSLDQVVTGEYILPNFAQKVGGNFMNTG